LSAAMSTTPRSMSACLRTGGLVPDCLAATGVGLLIGRDDCVWSSLSGNLRATSEADRGFDEDGGGAVLRRLLQVDFPSQVDTAPEASS
jgi:hypothetical protein